MKINKKIIKELSDYLDEFNLTELEYTEKDTKNKVSKNNSSISNQNKKVTKFMGKNPLFCGLLLLLVNQGVAASLEDPPKFPPDFPF